MWFLRRAPFAVMPATVPLDVTALVAEAEQGTPSAWRIWWYFGPDAGQITITEIGPHPD